MRHTHVRFSILLFVVLGCTSFLFADDNRLKQNLPVKLGTSGGNVNDRSNAFCCSGTLGALVTKGGTNYILSNNHVLARSGQAVAGEDVSQPGAIDVGCNIANTSIVADLSEAQPLGSNVDAALAQVRSGAVDSTGAILHVGVPASTIGTPAVGMPVAKSGRTTFLTCASIGSVNTSVSVRYQQGCGKGKKFTVNYTNQVVINSSSFSAGGDSGSLIVNSNTAQPVALLYAGSSSTTIGNPATEVAQKLGVSFVGGPQHSVSCTGAAAAAVALPDHEVDRARNVKERYAPGLMRDDAIQGVGVGAHPENPGEAAIVIYVEEGRAHGRIPSLIEGVRTVVIRTDRFRAYGWNEKEQPNSCSAK
ncbi:MAG: S1 family peptidase [Acidobacteriales bacterium]|nr:S1 family peptidase [Terriglobales bacterium]